MKFGLIGHPIARSLSPGLFKAAYDGKYPYDLIQGEDFEMSYAKFLEEYDGINVTAPFKELAYAKADIVSEECHLAKATNLLVKTPEGIKAYNSDFLGVRMWLKEVSGQKALIVGTGGAGKAAAAAAVSVGMECILMNRDMTRAENLKGSLREMGHEVEVRPIGDFCRCFADADVVIYNIPTEIPQIGELTAEDFTGGQKNILEANYKDPSFGEDFIARMKTVNPLAEYTGGRTWLLYQALTGYEIFTGEIPDLERMSSVL